MRYLRIKIEEMLKEIIENVHFNEADDNAEFPYIVYSFGSSVNNRGQFIQSLFIDIWDNSQIWERVDEIEEKLKKMDATSCLDENLQFTMYLDRVLNPGSGNIKLKRKTIVFEIKTIERG